MKDESMQEAEELKRFIEEDLPKIPKTTQRCALALYENFITDLDRIRDISGEPGVLITFRAVVEGKKVNVCTLFVDPEMGKIEPVTSSTLPTQGWERFIDAYDRARNFADRFYRLYKQPVPEEG